MTFMQRVYEAITITKKTKKWRKLNDVIGIKTLCHNTRDDINCYAVVISPITIFIFMFEIISLSDITFHLDFKLLEQEHSI